MGLTATLGGSLSWWDFDTRMSHYRPARNYCTEGAHGHNESCVHGSECMLGPKWNLQSDFGSISSISRRVI
jgi:hypothetical protein